MRPPRPLPSSPAQERAQAPRHNLRGRWTQLYGREKVGASGRGARAGGRRLWGCNGGVNTDDC